MLWGSKSSGKTGVLGALFDLAQSTAPEGVWSLSPGDADPATTEYLISARNALLERMSRPTHPRPDYPELLLTVQSRDVDPRSGESHYRLSTVRRGEPAAALMKPPADYDTRRGGQPRAPAPQPGASTGR